MMTKEKIVVFMDYANINRSACDNNYYLDYADLLEYLAGGRFLVDAHCYVPIDPRNEHKLDKEILHLWNSGYLVNTKVGKIIGDSYKCDFDIELTMDLLRIAYQVKPDIIVLASGDIDFIPVILELRRNGIRVEVASFERAISNDVLQKASGFINLDTYYNEYLSLNAPKTVNDNEEVFEEVPHTVDQSKEVENDNLQHDND